MKNTKIRRKILPGTAGTKKLVEKYGDRLVCVRYRYDAENGKKYKTVELIEEESSWRADRRRIPANKIVHIRVAYGEVGLGRTLRSLGARWNRVKKVWEVAYKDVINLGLEERIIEETEDRE